MSKRTKRMMKTSKKTFKTSANISLSASSLWIRQLFQAKQLLPFANQVHLLLLLESFMSHHGRKLAKLRPLTKRRPKPP
jgi:hypothetical protein